MLEDDVGIDEIEVVVRECEQGGQIVHGILAPVAMLVVLPGQGNHGRGDVEAYALAEMSA